MPLRTTRAESGYTTFTQAAIKRALQNGDTVLTNPFKDIREQGRYTRKTHYNTLQGPEAEYDVVVTIERWHRLSMQATADEIGISKNGYLRAEQGFYTNPDKVIAYFSAKYDISEYDLERAYNDWKTNVRHTHFRAFGQFTEQLPYHGHPLNCLLNNLRRPLSQGVLLLPITLTEFCKLLCISQSTATRWMNKPAQQQTVPSEILGALKEMGYTDIELRTLQQRYKEYRRGLWA